MNRPATAIAFLFLAACCASATQAEQAGGATSAESGEAYGLAADIVTRTNSIGQVDKLLDALRTRMIGVFVAKSGKSEADAASIVDTIVFPSVRDAMPSVRAAVVAIYVQNYDVEDLRGLDNFYRSTLGQHLLSHQPQVTAAISPAVSAIVATRVRKALQDHAAELRQRGVPL